MNKKEFQLILQEGEGKYIEFKEKLDKFLAKEVVAFANAAVGEVAVEKLSDRIFITNPGGVDFPKKEFGIVSRPRNSLLADLLSKTIYMEKVGTGISRMRIECEKNKNSITFDLHENNFFTTIKSNNIQVDEPVSPYGLVDGLVDSQKIIFERMRQNPHVSKRELVSIVGISSTAVDKNIDTLKKKKLIQRVGSPRSGYWKVCDSKGIKK